jgi:hypothetical protein
MPDLIGLPDPQVVEKRLYLGNKNHASGAFMLSMWLMILFAVNSLWFTDLDTLRQLNITHVINISRDTCTPFASEGIVYHQCYIADSVFDLVICLFTFQLP